MRLSLQGKQSTNVKTVIAANELDWHDFQAVAKKLEKKMKLEWDLVEIRRYSKKAKKRIVKSGIKKFVIEPGDLFMFLEDEEYIYLWVEGMKQPEDVSQRTYDTLFANSRNIRTGPVKKMDPPAATDTPVTKKSKPVVDTPEPSANNELIEQSMFARSGHHSPVASSDYATDKTLGYLYTMHGGSNVYLLGVGPRVIAGTLQQKPYAVYVDKANNILRSRDPVDMKKADLGLKTLRLNERLTWGEYKTAYSNAANHINNMLKQL